MKQFIAQITAATGLAGDHDAIDAAKTDAAQAFKSTDVVKSLSVFLGITVAISLIGAWLWGAGVLGAALSDMVSICALGAQHRRTRGDANVG